VKIKYILKIYLMTCKFKFTFSKIQKTQKALESKGMSEQNDLKLKRGNEEQVYNYNLY